MNDIANAQEALRAKLLRQDALAIEFHKLRHDVYECEGRTRPRGRIASAISYAAVRVRADGSAISHIFTASGGAIGHSGRVFDEHMDAETAVDFAARMAGGLEEFFVRKDAVGAL